MGHITWLPPRLTSGADDYAAASDHPSRQLLDRVIQNPSEEGAWTRLRDAYAEQAREWGAWTERQIHYLDPLADALASQPEAVRALEVCCGTGQATGLIAAHAQHVTAVDASAEMIERAPHLTRVTWLRADVRALPFSDAIFDLIVGLNAIPFAPELVRVASSTATIVWASSFGADTPLHLSPERFAALLGDEWAGTARAVGRGQWCKLERGG